MNGLYSNLYFPAFNFYILIPFILKRPFSKFDKDKDLSLRVRKVPEEDAECRV